MTQADPSSPESVFFGSRVLSPAAASASLALKFNRPSHIPSSRVRGWGNNDSENE